MAMFKQKQRVRGQDAAGFAPLESAGTPAEEAARNHSAGGLLRATREGLEWQLRDVAAALRIRADYLEALERNTVEGLPGPTYATGFLRAYAEYLGLDGHEIVRRFRTEKTGLHAKAELAFPVPLTDRGIPGGGIFLIAVLLAGLGYGTWYYLSSREHATPAAVEAVPAHLLPPPPSAPPPSLPQQAAEPPSQAETASIAVPPVVSAPAPIVSANVPPPAAAPAAPASQPPAAPPAAAAPVEADAAKPANRLYGEATPGRVVVRATAKAWVTVKDGEKPIVNTLFHPGDVFNAPDRKGLTMKTGNAGAVEIAVDGKKLAPLGPIGQIRTVPLDPEKLPGLVSRQ